MNTKYNPQPAKIFAGVVYVGVVMAASTLYISFVLQAFPADAYLSRAIMTLAGILIGASAIAFPVALHSWTIERNHHAWTTGFYYGEILFLAMNTVVAFMSLLSRNAGYAAPAWAIMFEPFSIMAIIYTLGSWGTVFILDPEHKRTQMDRQLKDDFETEVAKKRLEFVRSVEGENAIAAFASNDIQNLLANRGNGKTHFGAPLEVTANKPFEVKQADVELLAELQPRTNTPK